jgi:hypothetical protein
MLVLLVVFDLYFSSIEDAQVEVTLDSRFPQEHIITQKTTIDDPEHTKLGFIVDKIKVTASFPKTGSDPKTMDIVKEMLISSFINGEK